MTTTLGSTRVASTPEPSLPTPVATRSSHPGWRDPRLWIGVLIVAGSVLAGARIVGAADDTVSVWSVSADHAVGDALDSGDLAPRRVLFDDEADLDRYLRTSDPLPAQLHLTRPVGAGELLPRAAVGSAADSGIVSVPVSLPASAVPPDVAAGSHVQVWVSRDGEAAHPVLDDVTVLSAVSPDAQFGTGGERQLVLGLDAEQAAGLDRALAAIADGTVTVVGLG